MAKDSWLVFWGGVLALRWRLWGLRLPVLSNSRVRNVVHGGLDTVGRGWSGMQVQRRWVGFYQDETTLLTSVSVGAKQTDGAHGLPDIPWCPHATDGNSPWNLDACPSVLGHPCHGRFGVLPIHLLGLCLLPKSCNLGDKVSRHGRSLAECLQHVMGRQLPPT
jgi:hypothetical protein